MINSPFVRDGLKSFAGRTITYARENISNKGMTVSNDLADGLSYDIEFYKNSFWLEFLSDEKYWAFQEYGVKGAGLGAPPYDTPFSYTNLKPPVEVFIEWAKRKPILPRDKKSGKFITRESFGYAMREHIYQKGIIPKHFFQDAVEKSFESLPNEIVELYGLEVKKILKKIRDDISKKSV